MKEIESKAELFVKRPNRGTLKASEREVDQDFESLAVPIANRCPIAKRFNKKPKKSERLNYDRRRNRFTREIEGLDAILGLASFMREGELDNAGKEAAPPKRLLGRAATHVAIAVYIKFQQQQPSTPSTTS
mmetsp:Transcript_20395/g.38206  ORF Transcript_20395/g.38206 Transcript_20395/m.38206 type:complete len:131 (-) Transcript_20395:876-1268(-)